MLETVRRLLKGVDRSEPTTDAPEIPADNKAPPSPFHFTFDAFPRFGGLSFMGRSSIWGSAGAQSTDVQSTFVDTIQTLTTEDKVNKQNSIEADTPSTPEPVSKPLEETSSDEDEVQGLVDPQHERWSELDDMIDKILLEEDDDAGMEEVGSATAAEGIEVRALSVHRNLADEQAFQESAIDNASRIEIFPAYEMALRFHYILWLNNNGIFDFPHNALTAEAVDRLFTIGWLDLVDHFDSALACALLGHGAYRRIHRLTGVPTYGGRILQSQGNWTVSPDAHPPTGEEIEAFIREQEDARASNEDGDGCRANGYRLPFSQRPARDLGWEKQRLVRHGYWGLRCMDRDDDMAGAMIERYDLLFKSPERLAEQVAHESRQEASLTVSPTDAHADTPVNRGTKRRRDPSTDAPEDTNEKVEFPNRSPRSIKDTNKQSIYEDRQETCLPMNTTSVQPGTVADPASDSRKRRRDSFEDISENVGQMVARPDLDEDRQVSCLPVETVSALASTSASIDRRRQRHQLGEVPSRRSVRIESLKKEAAAKKAAEEAKFLIKANKDGKPKTRRRGR
ncbi:hypothetical protein DFH11DRAFT_1545670 [Phellopilus nigrolimitatus]|nr:hypothetical protein DFH11DRAFT_1545670 [Phellopilus nigrolimitatus]